MEHGTLVTVIGNLDLNYHGVSSSWLESTLESFLVEDDVITPEFFGTVLLVRKGNFDLTFTSVRTRWGTSIVQSVQVHEGTQTTLVTGPYLIHYGRLWQVLRLYDDVQKAFLVTLRPRLDGTFTCLNDGEHGWDCLSVAVQSRLHFQGGSSDLRKYRIAVKDAFNISGVKTSMCNRAYFRLFPMATSTAIAIAGLIDRGVQVLGKTKLSSFLSREEPSESVDYQTAWNPRGDGYQGPGGSSSGSAVAVAAYNWVDVGIGTDTNGSIRRPAQCNGVFGLRISQGVFPSTGMFTVFKRFDVPGIFTRDLNVLTDFAMKWYAAELVAPAITGLPLKLVVLSDNMPTESTPQKQAVMSIVQDLEAYLEIPPIRISLENLWASNPPDDAKGEKLYDFLQEVGASTFLYENFHSGAHFRDEYRKKFQQNPFVSDFVQWRWKIGEKYTLDQFNEGIRRLDVYKQWWLDTVLETGRMNTLVVMQSEEVKPNYRDDKAPGYYIQPAWHPWWISPILGAPEVVVPAGHIPYVSRITGRMEQLPVMASLLSEPSSDLNLLTLVRCFFEHAGRSPVVQSGKVMFEETDIEEIPSTPWEPVPSG
ncbi:amidase signature enzyme [Amniculicola lignicola CBS 123094]|uniref:Amidase signature enzyme n=1 Tax=Amniculicola lignicola CBS 123094 TaxID=1392246 RepID=A0A6A5X3Z4_9PLEO|nr:amidase signature enzyme [Amniculicola lignicola CBS 123094]